MVWQNGTPGQATCLNFACLLRRCQHEKDQEKASEGTQVEERKAQSGRQDEYRTLRRLDHVVHCCLDDSSAGTIRDVSFRFCSQGFSVSGSRAETTLVSEASLMTTHFFSRVPAGKDRTIEITCRPSTAPTLQQKP